MYENAFCFRLDSYFLLVYVGMLVSFLFLNLFSIYYHVHAVFSFHY